MTKREELIEAMARAAEPLAFVEDSPLRDEAWAMLAADRALTALEAALSIDLTAIAEGRAVVGKKRAGRLLDGIEHNGFPVIGGGNGAI